MGSDLYISIDVQHDGGGHRNPKVWSALWEGSSTDLARGIVVDAFRDFADRESDPRSGYLSGDEIRRMLETSCSTVAESRRITRLRASLLC